MLNEMGPSQSPWFLRTPREMFLEREVARLERELYAYKAYHERDNALRFTTLAEPEVMPVIEDKIVTLKLAVDWRSERADVGYHVIGRWGDDKEVFGYRYYITDFTLMQAIGGGSAIAARMHEKLVCEMSRMEKL